MKRAVPALAACSIGIALAGVGIAPQAVAQTVTGALGAERPASDSALREQIRSVVGRALEDGRSPEYIDQLVNEAAAEGKLFVPETMRLADGSVNTPAMLAFLDGNAPSFQPPIEGGTATAATAAAGAAGAGAATATASGSQLLQPATGASGAAGATGTATAAASQPAQPFPAPSATASTQPAQPLPTPTATAGAQPSQPVPTAPAAAPSSPSSPTILTATGSQVLQPPSGAAPQPAADVATAAQIGTQAAQPAAEPAETAGTTVASVATQPLQPGEGATAATPAVPGGQLLQPAPGSATAQPADGTETAALGDAEPADTGPADTGAAPEPAPAPTAEADIASTGTAAAEPEFYIVQRGDSLSTISERLYGDPFRFEQIFEANRDQLSNPNVIVEGQRLFIPR